MLISAINELLKSLFYPFTEAGKLEQYHREMNEFLSQATDRSHLEYLQRMWDKKRGYGAY